MLDRSFGGATLGNDAGGHLAANRISAEQCRENFKDLQPPLDSNQARVAAERCLFCYDAPCVTACPTSIDIPLFIRQIAGGQPVAAARAILDANVMGAMCARVCPTENLCEGACVRETAESQAVEIGRLQRFATDAAFASGRQFYRAGPPTGRHVAVVGAGPAGLACAHALARAGHQVTIYEARDKGGGLNEYGIAAYKTNDDIAQRELAYILDVGGIHMEYGKTLGRDFTLASLQAGHDAVFLGLGLGDTNGLGLGEPPEGVVDAVDFIATLRQATDKTAVPVGNNVLVIGGGMTAIDAATQAKLLGAECVTIVYRRAKTAMPASQYEQAVAQVRGVLIRENLMPAAIESRDGMVSGVTFEPTRSDGGRLIGTGERVTLAADHVLTAIGQVLRGTDLAGSGLALEKGRIAVDAERRTSLPGVWAGGDCVAGGSDLTVAAVEDGKKAAASIIAALAAMAAVAPLRAGA
ncbi:MAG: NAD(P)-dependent oxidoreductase [Bradyrhizobium sp.]|uniref:NAD(P)-dependent oxidoreductase n=1 Tax=Bradyrhizobium sp. TaxID=376 RepID=UPI001DCAF9A5|nr:NAD(P)-dependent oxidoreductase [Bradyrhizobium sp.]MBV9564346.1 NAD(P)-dependent oxidoreductase [Bradyrhizobium sp.]